MAEQSVSVNISALSSAIAGAIQQATSSQPQPPTPIPGSSHGQTQLPPSAPATTHQEANIPSENPHSST